MGNDTAIIKISVANGKCSKNWTSQETTWIDFAKQILKHREVKNKDGACFVPGSLRGSSRNKESIEELYLLGLDSDGVATLDHLKAILLKYGYEAVIYSTHSHLTTTTTVTDPVLNGRTAEQYLREEKHYIESACRGATMEVQNAEPICADTKQIVTFKHGPLPKCRIVIPLKSPWKASNYATREEAVSDWEARYKAFCSVLDVPFDLTCSEAARLFYLPSCPPGAEHFSEHIPGKPLDLYAIEIPAQKPEKRQETIGHSFCVASDDASVIDEYNRHFSVESILSQHGYSLKGHKWLAPGSTSKEPGGTIKDGRYFSHHGAGSDPLSKLNSDGGAHDAFSCYCVLEHGGDQKAAVHEAARLLGMNGNRKPSANTPQDVVSCLPETEKEDPFQGARSLFPRIPFPWEILPEKLSQSLQQLARACATSSTPLPGTCFALVAAAMGRKYSISPKLGWHEPLILWHGDIRASGDGKTPATRILCEKIEDLQREEHKRFDAEAEFYDGLPKKDKEATAPPVPPRGYFLTGMTLEGLRDDLHNHPTGGLVVIQDELSAFVSAQNQYKGGKGDDRESWLKFFDGHDARIGRSKQSILITGARPSLVGGIQPAIFRKAFTSEDGVYLSDGTIFRFLLTYDRSQHYPLTSEVWTEKNREVWEPLLLRAFYWTEHYDPIQAIFDSQAQQRFFDWRNDLDAQKGELPAILRGFIPKAVSYAVRLAGIIHCIHAFHQGVEPGRVLNLIDVERGIKAVEFYLGQIVDAMQLIEDEEHKPIDERAMVLAQVLDGLRGEVDSGRLAIGFIMDRFNSVVLDHRTFKTPHAFGAFLRECKLNVSEGKHDANGKRASKCLLWDEKAEIFIKESLQCLHSLQSKTDKRFADADIDVCKSALSAISFPTDFNPDEMQTLQTLKNECLQPQISTEQRVTDIADNADIVSVKKCCSACQHFTPNQMDPIQKAGVCPIGIDGRYSLLPTDGSGCGAFEAEVKP